MLAPCPCCMRPYGRRAWLAAGLACAAAPALGQAGGAPRRLLLAHVDGERFEGIYWRDGVHDPEALAAIAWLFRDREEGLAGPLDPALLDTLWLLDQRVPGRGFEVASAFRTARTQAALAARLGRAATDSLHVQGRAVDVRRPGLHALGLVGAAWQLGRGGVGLYRGAIPFVHLDTGPRRRW